MADEIPAASAHWTVFSCLHSLARPNELLLAKDSAVAVKVRVPGTSSYGYANVIS